MPDSRMDASEKRRILEDFDAFIANNGGEPSSEGPFRRDTIRGVSGVGRDSNPADILRDFDAFVADGGNLPAVAEGEEGGLFNTAVDYAKGLAPAFQFVKGLTDAGTNAAILGLRPQAEGLEGGIGSLVTGGSFSEGYEQGRDAFREDIKSFRETHPAAALAAEITGGILSPLPMGKGRAARAGIGAVTGGVAGAAEAQEEDLLDMLRAGVSGAVTGGAGTAAIDSLLNVGRRVLNPLTGGPGVTRVREGIEGVGEQPYQDALKVLKKEGVTEFTPGQKSGSTAQVIDETTLRGAPFGGWLDQRFKRVYRQTQRALMKKAGFRDKDAEQGLVTDETLKRAQNRFAQRYDAFYNSLPRVKFKRESVFGDTIGDLRGAYDELSDIEKRSSVTQTLKSLDKLLDKNSRNIQLKSIRNNISARIRNEKDYQARQFLFAAREALDDGITQIVGGAKAREFQKINRDYRNFKVLEKANAVGQSDNARGYLGPGRLYQAAKERNATGDFLALARAASRVNDTSPNSQTGTRSLGVVMGGLRQLGRVGGNISNATGIPRAVDSPAADRLASKLPTAAVTAGGGNIIGAESLLGTIFPEDEYP